MKPDLFNFICPALTSELIYGDWYFRLLVDVSPFNLPDSKPTIKKIVIIQETFKTIIELGENKGSLFDEYFNWPDSALSFVGDDPDRRLQGLKFREICCQCFKFLGGNALTCSFGKVFIPALKDTAAC